MLRILSVVSFFAMMSLPTHAADSALSSDVAQLQVSAQHVHKAAPDMATLQLTITQEAAKHKEAKLQADNILRAVKNELSAASVDEKFIRTGAVSIQPRYSYRDNRDRVLEGYVARYNIIVELHALDKVADIMQRMAAADVDRIDSVRYGLRDNAGAYNIALERAVKKARSKASIMARAASVTLGDVLRLSEQGGGQHFPQPVMMRAASMMEADNTAPSSPSLPAGEIEVKATAMIVYELQN